jgi:acyl-coenzyme A thioesterase PaaI-like protein
MNLWPPFLGAGIRVRRIAPDFREVVVEMPLRLRNRNYFGTHFGGSLYAMTDPFFALMVLHNLPPDYLVWDKAGSIEYVAPGRSRVRATFRLEQSDIDVILKMTAAGDKHLHVFGVDIVDREGLVVAKVQKVVYVRKKPGRGSRTEVAATLPTAASKS